jgi:hypothetical protein
MATEKQLHANRKNARLSTGPKSATGKAIVSGNRIRHGILSNKLLLDSECLEDYQALLDDLHAQLKPSGALEFTLVEKIAVTLWRQQRLVRAETATIALDANPRRIAHEVGAGMGRAGSIDIDDMQPPDPTQLTWLRAVIAELDEAASLELENLKDAAPLTYEQLASDADEEDESVEEYLAEIDLHDYLRELRSGCNEKLHKYEQYPALCAMADTVRDKLNIPWSRLELLSKYQTTLDNQLYRTMKALRDAQQWRLQSIDADVVSASNNISAVA